MKPFASAAHPLSVAALLLAALAGFWPGQSRAADRSVLSTHVPAAIHQLAPVGRLDPARRLNLAIGLPLRNQEALSKFLQDLYDPASPAYRKYLTPTEFTERFGPTAEDYQAVAAFAKAHGLTVTVTHPNRVVLDVSGAAADIEKAFHLTLRTYQHPTEARQFFAPDAEPSLDLATPVLHISGLDDYSIPRPKLHRSEQAAKDQLKPKAGSGPGGGYAGGDFRAAYVPGVARTGTGQSVGLLQFDGYYTADITAYETQFGLPNVQLVNVAIDGGVPTPGSGNSEVCLDIEMVMSMAPGVSTIYLYEAPNPSPFVDILSRMANDNLSRQLSCSWGGGGPDPTSEAVFQQMAAQGQSFFNASGDSDAFSGTVPFPSDSPNITQVGGTTLTTTGPGSAYVSETVWNWGGGTGSSGGISTTYAIPVWQQGISMVANQGSTTMRNIPDVALTGDNVYVRFDNGSGGIFGGTSCAAPLWAGYLALMNEQAVQNSQPPLGFINPAIYAIGKGANYATDFHDTTSGNNFRTGSTTKFAATTGYDLCTGWGSPAGPALMAALAGSADSLQVTPAPFAASGTLGGPFAPSSQSYTLTNNGQATLVWTASKGQPWSTLSATSGTLAPGGMATVIWSLNPATNALAAGNYADTLRFSNQTRGTAQAFGLTLVISPLRVAYFPLDTDPGWVRQSPWAYGTPTGGGGNTSSYPDPTSGATGSKVFGVNLAGDYSTGRGGPFYVTTGAINLSQYANTQLRFKRWLNENQPSAAVATVDVSNDNVNWTNLFTNGDAITEDSWVPEQYGISAVADGHSTVYFRWGHRVPAHSNTAYAGWNIDDIEIVGTPAAALTLALGTSNVTEGAPSFNATLSISPAPASDTAVTLFSTDPASASVPATVTISAGQSSVSVPVTVGDDSLLNGTRSVLLTATATGYAPSAATLTVNDNEAATLAVNAPANVGDVSSIQGTISLSAVSTGNISVNLTSSDPTLLQVPAVIVVPAGSTYANLLIAVVKANQAGPHSATITAHVNGWTDGAATITILPSASTTLALSLPANIVEGATGTGLVSIGSPAASALSVSLGSSNTGRLTVPASVNIPAGSASVTFIVTAPDNNVIDGTANVTVTASASGFTGGSGNVAVLDDDVPPALSVSAGGFSASGVVGGPFTPPSQSWTVTNTGGGSLNWTASAQQPWLTVAPASGTLTAGQNVTVTASLNAAANSLAAGDYSDTVSFSGGGAPGSTTRAVALTVTPPPPALSVTAGGFSASGVVGGPFTPPSQSWTVTNTGGGSLNWTASAQQPWLTVAPASGTLTAGQNVTVTASLNTAANTLTAGNYSDTVSFSGGGAPGSTTRAVALTVTPPPPALSVTAGGFSASGVVGGPFTPPSQSWTVTNTGGGSLNWTASAQQPWLTVAPASGTLTAGQNVTVTASLNTAANSLAAGDYSDTVSFSGGGAPGSTTRAVALTVTPPPPALSVTAGGFSASGVVGGPFTPPSQSWTVTNTGGGSLNWTASAQQPWLTVAPASGTLTAGQNVTVTASLNTAANSLAAGDYSDTVSFSGGGAPGNTTRAVALTVTPPPPALSVTAGGFSASGVVGGPFTPPSQSWTVTNTGGGSLNWTASAQQPWLTVAPASGTLTAGQNVTVTASLNTAANSLAAGDYSDTVSFSGGGAPGNTTRAVALTVTPPPPALSVTAGGFSASGVVGGPFTPPSQSWTVTNTGGGSLNWTASAQQPWLTVAPASGTLTAGQNVTVTASLNTAANSLAIGNWYDTVAFSAGGAPGSATRGAALAVTPVAPMLAAEPAFTGGLSNSPSWSAVNGGDLYEAQYATDLAFSNPVSSGLIAATSTTFTGLADATLYRYRVHARRTVTTTTAAWMQTSQGDFNSDTGTNVTATPSGDVLLVDVSQAGTLVSPVIAPSLWNGWGQLTDTVTLGPPGATLTIDVLDATGALLAANVASGTDLSAIPAVAAQSAIELRANLATTNGTSPALSDWTLSYHPMLASTIDGPWSSSISSTQDASAPALVITSPASLKSTRSSITIQGTASDLSGVQSLSLNGVLVTTSDNFAHWSVAVENLQLGVNLLNFSATDNATPPNSAIIPLQITGVTPTDANGNGLPDAWEAQYGIAGGANDTFNGNGVPNLIAYALDLDPTAIDTSLLPSLSIQINPADQLPYLVFSYRRLLDNLGLDYEVEVSPDLSNWSSAGAALEQVTPSVMNADGLSETVTVRIKPALGPGTLLEFVRLRVSANH